MNPFMKRVFENPLEKRAKQLGMIDFADFQLVDYFNPLKVFTYPLKNSASKLRRIIFVESHFFQSLRQQRLLQIVPKS